MSGPQIHVGFKQVVQGLVYPAILGAVFYNLLPIFFDAAIVLGRPLFVISELLILAYFALDYYYTVVFPTYRWVAGVCDLLALVMLYRVEHLMNPLINGGYVPAVALYMAGIHLAWFAWVVVERDYDMIPTKLGFAVLFAAQYLWWPALTSFVALQVLVIASYWLTATTAHHWVLRLLARRPVAAPPKTAPDLRLTAGGA